MEWLGLLTSLFLMSVNIIHADVMCENCACNIDNIVCRDEPVASLIAYSHILKEIHYQTSIDLRFNDDIEDIRISDLAAVFPKMTTLYLGEIAKCMRGLPSNVVVHQTCDGKFIFHTESNRFT